MTTYFIATFVAVPAFTYVVGIALLAVAGREWRAVGLWCVYFPLAALLFASWLSMYSFGLVLLPATVVLLVFAVVTTLVTRTRSGAPSHGRG